MQASISRQAATTRVQPPNQSVGYGLLVVITVVMSILPLVLVSLHPQTILMSGSPITRTTHQEIRPLLMTQIGLPERWCNTPGHAPHPVPAPTLNMWMALSPALIGVCVMQAAVHLRSSADRFILQTHGTPPTPPPRTLHSLRTLHSS